MGDLSLDTEQRVALRDGRTIDLTAKEYDLIELLMKNPRRVYSRESLMNLVWGYSYAGTIARWTYTSAVCGKSWRKHRRSRSTS